MSLRLEVVGPFKGSSGYDRHTREFVREFVRQGVTVQLTPLDGWSTEMPAEWQEKWLDELCQDVSAETVLHFTMPIHARPRFGKRNVNYTMFEADRIPDAWARRAFAQDLVVVPVQAAYDAWRASGVPRDLLRIGPLGVHAQHFGNAEAAPLTMPDGRAVASFTRRFLNVAELRPRKNHLGLLRTWIHATQPHDDACLILKIGGGQTALAQFQADVHEMQRVLGRSLAEAAPVLILPQQLSPQQVRSLYASATHYWSMSFGESWDLPMMEAAVSGLSLLAPRHTSYLSYLRDEDAHWIRSSKEAARFEGKTGAEDWVFFAGTNWWRPDEEEAAGVVRRIVDGTGPEISAPGGRIAAEYTWEKAAARLLELVF